jgi:hypothetical protein
MERAMIYDEFLGVTQRVSYLIEKCRVAPEETKCDILDRVLRSTVQLEEDADADGIDLGEGVQLANGERLFLFLFEDNKKSNKPNAIIVSI